MHIEIEFIEKSSESNLMGFLETVGDIKIQLATSR